MSGTFDIDIYVVALQVIVPKQVGFSMNMEIYFTLYWMKC